MNHEVTADDFESGTKPDQTTYCSPWLLATLKPGVIQFKQGTLTAEFTNAVATDASQYIDTGD
jgi:hypothetical protein